MLTLPHKTASRAARPAWTMFLGVGFQLLLPLPVLLDAVGGVGRLDVGRLDELPDAPPPPLHVFKLRLDGFQLLTLLPGDPVHLLVQ